MDIKDIRKIIEMMKQNDLSEFELEDEGFRIAIRRRNGLESHVIAAPAPAPVHAHPVIVAPPPPVPPALTANDTAPGDAVAPQPEPETAGERITSPMVGTFYRSPSPDVDPFVSAGSEVDEDTVVCIIEAMKVMNEIKAETRGVVRSILVENAAPVQFGQPLFAIEPA